MGEMLYMCVLVFYRQSLMKQAIKDLNIECL